MPLFYEVEEIKVVRKPCKVPQMVPAITRTGKPSKTKTVEKLVDSFTETKVPHVVIRGFAPDEMKRLRKRMRRSPNAVLQDRDRIYFRRLIGGSRTMNAVNESRSR